MDAYDGVDLFAGPGGWDCAARRMGLRVLGFEWDDAACATRRAAGLPTVQGDVALLDPREHGTRGKGLIASPPCGPWSAAGKRLALIDRPLCLEAMESLLRGEDRRVELGARCLDERSMLVVEPIRWIVALNPEWIALEQVPNVIGLWRWIADHLERQGYFVCTATVNAADYGVPQLRKRAVLLASRTRMVGFPAPTQRRTMADALGWGITDGPSGTVVGRVAGTGAPNPLDGGTGGRKRYYDARAQGRWIERPGNDASTSNWQAMRPSVEEAAVLQSFPADWPWQGDVRKVIEQVGNAVPPLMAEGLLTAVC